METLQELTGQESGIVIYSGNGGQPEAVVCNWSNVKGFPRVDPFCLTVLGFGEEIPPVEGVIIDDISSRLEGVEIVFANDEDMPASGTAYQIENILVIAPSGWN